VCVFTKSMYVQKMWTPFNLGSIQIAETNQQLLNFRCRKNA
jgi:hypothetical protein